MADESNLGTVTAGRALRWGGVGLLVLVAVALYLRDGRRVPPLAAPAADRADTTSR
jgi:hypothetical protein